MVIRMKEFGATSATVVQFVSGVDRKRVQLIKQIKPAVVSSRSRPHKRASRAMTLFAITGRQSPLARKVRTREIVVCHLEAPRRRNGIRPTLTRAGRAGWRTLNRPGFWPSDLNGATRRGACP